MKELVLADAGPLVALLDRRDQFHEWALAQFGILRPPLITCEPVLAEACFILRRQRGGAEAVMGLVERGVLKCTPIIDREVKLLTRLLGRYANVPMSLADACLVRLSELHPGSAVLTLDRDFKIYRRHSRETIRTVMPGEDAEQARACPSPLFCISPEWLQGLHYFSRSRLPVPGLRRRGRRVGAQRGQAGRGSAKLSPWAPAAVDRSTTIRVEVRDPAAIAAIQGRPPPAIRRDGGHPLIVDDSGSMKNQRQTLTDNLIASSRSSPSRRASRSASPALTPPTEASCAAR